MTQPTTMSSAATAPAGMPTAISPQSSSPDDMVGPTMPAFYDDQLFTINFKELPAGGETATLLHNGSINTIYMSENCRPGGKMFTAVLDAIQGDGFNPLWNEVEVNFKTPSACKQFTRDDAIVAAANAPNPTITLQPTNEVYRCSVLGPKK